MFDVAAVEVLRGPQGTLYGRNATGGTINFITNRPTQEVDVGVAALYGAFGRTRFEGVISGGLSDDGCARLSWWTIAEGFADNAHLGDTFGFRDRTAGASPRAGISAAPCGWTPPSIASGIDGRHPAHAAEFQHHRARQQSDLRPPRLGLPIRATSALSLKPMASACWKAATSLSIGISRPMALRSITSYTHVGFSISARTGTAPDPWCCPIALRIPRPGSKIQPSVRPV